MYLPGKVPVGISNNMDLPVPNVPAVPEKRKLEIEKRRRIDRFGELVIDRRIQAEGLQYPFDPQRPLIPTLIQSGSSGEKLLARSFSKGNLLRLIKEIDVIQELMLKPVQDRLYKNLYVFSDNDDDMEDINTRYRYISEGFKDFIQQKNSLSSGKGQSEYVES